MWITDLYAKKAVERIRNHNASSPLFLFLSFQAPHMKIQTPPAKYMSQYSGVEQIYQSISKPAKRTDLERAAAITALDTGVGKVVDALKTAGLYHDSVIIFTTDNGGPLRKKSNFPLRSKKMWLYEGGVRAVGWVHSPHICKRDRVDNNMMFVTDWFATLLSIAGLNSHIPANKDSFDMWNSISKNKRSPRREIILNLDEDKEKGLWSAAMIRNSYKLIWGQQALLGKLPVREAFRIKKSQNCGPFPYLP